MEEKDGFDNGAIAADISENERILPVSEEKEVRIRRKSIVIILNIFQLYFYKLSPLNPQFHFL